jgi:signal transduction histidine kinase
MFCRKACLLLSGCFWWVTAGVFAQDQGKADSLAVIYQQNTLTNTRRFKLLADLSFNEIKDLKKGLGYAEELIRLAEGVRDTNQVRIGYFLKGTKERSLGNLDKALTAYFISARLARKTHHLKAEGEVYGAIADIYAVDENFPKAMHYYNKAIATLRQCKGDSTNLACVLSNAGDAYRKAQKYDSALVYLNEAKVIFEAADHPSGKAYSLGNIGMVYASIGKNALAEKNINEAICILEEAQDYYPICDYLVSMADVYLDKGDRQTALDHVLRSLRLAERHGLKKQIADASLKLSGLYEETANERVALAYYKKHIAYRDSVSNLDMVQKMADQRADYEIAQKQLEVEQANREKHEQRTILLALFIILGLTIMLLATFYGFYKYKAKEEMRLHQQELLKVRLEIQEQTYRTISQELHDNIGQMLSLVLLNINTVDVLNAEATKEKLAGSKTLLKKTIQDLRDISKTLNTDFINEIGLTHAVDQQLQLLKRTGIYSTQLVVEGDQYGCEPERELMIFRVVQELLNNIVRHAGANQIIVSMKYELEKLVIKVCDNGQGFDVQTQELSHDRGLGLRNIPNRLKLIRGAIFLESELKKGTTATIEILN